jgi:hypothetical protein
MALSGKLNTPFGDKTNNSRKGRIEGLSEKPCQLSDSLSCVYQLYLDILDLPGLILI